MRVEFDDSEKIVRMMHIIKPYEMILVTMMDEVYYEYIFFKKPWHD